MYRSYKTFNEVMFAEKLGQTPYHVPEISRAINVKIRTGENVTNIEHLLPGRCPVTQNICQRLPPSTHSQT